MLQFRAFLTKLAFLPALAALLFADAPAQESSPDAGVSPESATGTRQVMEEVIVRGRRLSEIEFDLRIYVRDFLEEVAAPARGRGYARWRRGVCIGVHNLESAPAQYIVDRISSLALEVGLEPGEPACRPQVNIAFAANAREMASLMVERAPRVFRPIGGNAGMDLGLEALEEFVESDKPVRWWHVSLPVDSRTGVPAIRIPGQGIPWISVAGPSRLHSGVRDDLRYVIIVVDSTKLTGTTWQQLADYLAIVSLAQIDPWTDPAAFDSILNLFGNPAAYSGLTDWDRSYIQALYAFNQERNARLQGNEIVSRIARRELEAIE
ncbi:MAG TPA: hypothetical protein VMR74_14085 [Gammaproteobacteria bacterium]|nr:hypothetical protein [Gammaproteobacteria bacterium]